MSWVNWRQLCADAKKALTAGRRVEARRLALRAAELAPNQEEPWLLLAAMASPRASQGYLKQALAINPNSKRALKGLHWAEERLAERRAPKVSGQAQGASEALPALPRFGGLALVGMVAMAGLFVAFAWMRPPVIDEGMRYMSAAAAGQIDALLATEEPSATPTETTSPTATFTSTPEPSKTPSATPSPSITPTPSRTPTPTAEFALEKQFLELPVGLQTEERWIEVNLTTQTLSAYEGDKMVRSFTISSGRPNSPTVVGEFRVWAKVRIQAMSGPGYYIENVPWVMYFYGDYGIHGTWWHNNFGTPMSAGCVNMTIEDARWMYEWASIGTIVDVHY